MQVDVVASIPAGTNTIGNVKLTDGSETASVNASNQLETAEANSGDIKTAVETLLFDTGKDDYTHSDSADIVGHPYFGIFVGTGGDIRLNTGASGGGSDLLFKNVSQSRSYKCLYCYHFKNTKSVAVVFVE